MSAEMIDLTSNGRNCQFLSCGAICRAGALLSELSLQVDFSTVARHCRPSLHFSVISVEHQNNSDKRSVQRRGNVRAQHGSGMTFTFWA